MSCNLFLYSKYLLLSMSAAEDLRTFLTKHGVAAALITKIMGKAEDGCLGVSSLSDWAGYFSATAGQPDFYESAVQTDILHGTDFEADRVQRSRVRVCWSKAKAELDKPAAPSEPT